MTSGAAEVRSDLTTKEAQAGAGQATVDEATKWCCWWLNVPFPRWFCERALFAWRLKHGRMMVVLCRVGLRAERNKQLTVPNLKRCRRTGDCNCRGRVPKRKNLLADAVQVRHHMQHGKWVLIGGDD